MSSTETKSTSKAAAKEPDQVFVARVTGTSEIVPGFVGPFESQEDLDSWSAELSGNVLGVGVEQFPLTDPEDVLDANPQTKAAKDWAGHAEQLREEIKAAAEE